VWKSEQFYFAYYKLAIKLLLFFFINLYQSYTFSTTTFTQHKKFGPYTREENEKNYINKYGNSLIFVEHLTGTKVLK